jgi:MFS family permease
MTETFAPSITSREAAIIDGKPSKRSLLALDGLNFFMADITGGVGPFLALYLKSALHLNPADVGIVLAAGDVCSLLAQTPAGALVDWIRNKRMIIVVAALMTTLCSLVLAFYPNYYAVLGTQIVMGAARAFFPPAVAAITLGLVGQANFPKRTGRNAAFDHAGNVVAAFLCGIVSKVFSMGAIFIMMAGMALASFSVVFAVDPKEINENAARGKKLVEPGAAPSCAGIRDILLNHRMLIFIGSVVLFHFANAAMLPQVGQKVAETKIMHPGICMAACIIVAQLTMVPTALIASKFACSWGRKPIFLLGFLTLPLRAILFALNDNPYSLILIQVLDGIGAGIFGVLSLIVIADLTSGSGRFNLVQGVLATGVGIGASMSNLVIGFIVKNAGYNVGFFTLAGIALVATACFAMLMPETKHLEQSSI